MICDIIYEMIQINRQDKKRINHALKVYGLTKCIAGKENVDKDTLRTIEISAVLHDIAILYCEEKYGACGGHLQQKEGPAIARPILEKYTSDQKLIDRVLYIIAHHHMYEHIDDIDLQIIIEADFLVNADEGDISKQAFATFYQKYFKTDAGKQLAQIMFDL